MKILLLFTLLLFPTFAFSQSVKDLFLQIPHDVLDVPTENRPKLITETGDSLLTFRLSETSRGELKIVAQKKGEILLGISVSDCESSSLQFWNVKNSVWKEITKDVIQSLGAKDVVAILKASPAAINNPNQSLEIAYFYQFAADSNALQLIARKQDSCEIAGKIYGYKFNGKKYQITK